MLLMEYVNFTFVPPRRYPKLDCYIDLEMSCFSICKFKDGPLMRNGCFF
jgi:hypothetical protein